MAKTPVPSPMPSQQISPVFIRCPHCKTENKSKAKNCKQCGWDLSQPDVWMPTWKWHLKTLGIIYAILIVVYFVVDALLRQLPPPHDIRQIPKELTPWLDK